MVLAIAGPLEPSNIFVSASFALSFHGAAETAEGINKATTAVIIRILIFIFFLY
jgi:hypothetical protein